MSQNILKINIDANTLKYRVTERIALSREE